MSKVPQEEWIDWVDAKVLQKAVVIDEADNVLVLKRTEVGLGSRPGKWDLPGGNISPEDLTEETQEPMKKAILREVLEETGLLAIVKDTYYLASWIKARENGNKVLGLAFGASCTVVGIKPEVRLSDEHIDYQWILPGQALTLDYGDDNGMFVKILNHFSPSPVIK